MCLSKAVAFVCRKCFGFNSSAEDNGDMTPDGDVIEKSTKFLYLKNVLSSRGGVQEAVTARIRSELKKLKDIASALCKRIV